MAKTRLCSIEAVASGSILECEAGKGRKVCVARCGEEFFAFQAACPHQELPLCDGVMEGHVLTCLGHLWQWNARTGEPEGLAEQPLQTYRVVRKGDLLYLEE